MTNPTHVCPQCGTPQPDGTPAGMCPRCLLSLGFQAAAAAPLPPEEGGTLVLEVAPTNTSSPLLTPGEQPGHRIGRYKLLESIGEGGFGTVWMAEQTEPVRRKVALKIIKLGMDTREVVARFEAERQALAMMDHPNIARVFDGGATDTGRPYFVMELVRGVRITEYCDACRLNTEERLKLFMEVCQAVQHAHQKGIIHRDLKPSNVLVTEVDGQAVPKVIDFGIAKATGGHLTDKSFFTGFNHVLGTPAYMSPEQAGLGGLDIDTRSDVYSLGVLMYELLTGQPPFSHEELLNAGLDEVLRAIREKEPPKPSTRLSTLAQEDLRTLAAQRRTDPAKLNRQVRGELDWIVLKALEKDRKRRYESPGSLTRDIERYLNQEPVLAGAPGFGYRVAKFARRHRVALGTAVTFFLVVLGGAAISVWQAVRATNAEQEQKYLRTIAQTDRDAAVKAWKVAQEERDRAEQQRTNAERNLYIANMNLLPQAWQQNDLRGAQQLLDETAAHPERGFEWSYWFRLLHLDIRTLRAHQAPVFSVAFSPDGRQIVTGSRDRTAKIWESGSGKELLTLRGHRSGVTAVAFSPDGGRILTGSEIFDKTAKLWETATGKELLTLVGHSNQITSVAFSSDGRHILTGSWDGTAKIWQSDSGRELRTFRVSRGFSVPSVSFSPDGQRIVAGSRDYTAKVWDVVNGDELLVLRHRRPVRAAVYSPDGRRILTGSEDGTARIWDAVGGGELLVIDGHSNGTFAVTFSPDGRKILTGGMDSTARIWDAATGKAMHTFKGHLDGLRAVAFSPDQQWIATSGWDSTAKIWSSAGTNEVRLLHAHRGELTSVAVSAHGDRIATSGDDRSARIWDASTGNELLTLQGHGTSVTCVAFSPNNRQIVTAGRDGITKLWDSVSGKELFSFQGHTNAVTSIALSPDGQRMVTGSEDKTVKMWETSTGRRLLVLKHNDAVSSATFAPDGRSILTGSHEQTRVWDATTGKVLRTFLTTNLLIRSAAFSPDGRRIVAGGWDNSTMGGHDVAKVWDAVTGQELFILRGHRDRIMSVCCSPDGRRILTGSWDQSVKLWEATSGRVVLNLPADRARVVCALFFPDGQRVVSGYDDGTVRIWEAATADRVAAWQEQKK